MTRAIGERAAGTPANHALKLSALRLQPCNLAIWRDETKRIMHGFASWTPDRPSL